MAPRDLTSMIPPFSWESSVSLSVPASKTVKHYFGEKPQHSIEILTKIIY